MPTYEYECDACKHRYEKFQSMKDAADRKCPKCGKLKVRRLLGTGAGILFKGSGFYQTDYRSSSYQEKAKADKPAEKPAADSKPAAKDPAPAPKPKPKGSDPF